MTVAKTAVSAIDHVSASLQTRTTERGVAVDKYILFLLPQQTMRIFSTVAVTLLLVVAAVGVTPAVASAQQTDGNCEFPVTVTDATGTEITIEERPDRVTTTNPSAAQTMWEIGGREQVVGLTQYASYLNGSESRTNVSASFGVSVERVVGTNPDLVIAPNASAADVEGLRQAGLTVYHLPEATDTDDIREKTTTIGRLTGNCAGASDTNAWMDANVAAVENVSADVEDRPTVLYPLGEGYVAADGTFIDAIFGIAGADNAAGEYSGYAELTNEVIRELDPDVLVLNERTSYLIDEIPYSLTTAGEQNAVVTVRERDLSQPAPRSVVNSVHNISSQLYPDRYDEGSYVPRSEFQSQAESETATTEADDGFVTTEGSGPGFTAVTALLAAVVASLLARRRA